MHHTNSPSNLPEIGKKIASKANRAGVAERFEDRAGQKTLALDLALITSDDELLKDRARFLLTTAKPHHAPTLSLLQTVPGIGKILSLVLLYESHDRQRFPSVQDFASSCRLIKYSKESGGKRLGTSGHKIGHAPLTWALSEAATLFLRNHLPGQTLLARWEKTPAKGQALRSLAHTLARAVSDMLQRPVAFHRDRFLPT